MSLPIRSPQVASRLSPSNAVYLACLSKQWSDFVFLPGTRVIVATGRFRYRQGAVTQPPGKRWLDTVGVALDANSAQGHKAETRLFTPTQLIIFP